MNTSELYSKTNMMHFLFNLFTIKGLYMFRAILAHLQETMQKMALGILCACYVSWLHSNPGTANRHNVHQVSFLQYLLRISV
jgi:multisubunit Na+/H+ antiporter MnhE subunit